LFSRKDERDTKSAAAMPTTGMTEMKQNGSKPAMRMSTETVSKLGAGMVITGNIMCDGALQIFGHVLGDIHATQLAATAVIAPVWARFLATYPDAGLKIAATLGTKVAKGEMTWG